MAAGTIAFADAVRTVRRRGRYMQESRARWTRRDVGDPRTRWRVGGARLRGSGRGRSRRAGEFDAPGQVVIAGTAAAVEQAGERAKRSARSGWSRSGQRAVPLCADAAGAGTSRAELRAVGRHADGAGGGQRRRGAENRRTVGDRGAGATGVAPVRWEEVVRTLASAGIRAYVEVGPGTVLGGLVRKIDRNARVANLEAPSDLDAVERLVAEITA